MDSSVSAAGFIHRAKDASDPSLALKWLVEDCAVATKADCAGLYGLDLANVAHTLVHAVGTDELPPSFPLEPRQERSLPATVIGEALRSGESKSKHDPRAAAVHSAVPIIRAGVCLGAVYVRVPTHLSDDQLAGMASAADLALILLETRDVLQMLRRSQEPVDFDQPLDDFLRDILRLIAGASGMPYIALREREEDADTLRCIGAFGFDADKGALDLSPISAYPSFLKTLDSGDSVIEPTIERSGLESLRSRDVLRSIKSFVVCPVKVGTGVWGTLSFAAPIPFPFGEFKLKLAAFESISNGIGVAIVNYRNFHRARDNDFNLARAGAALTAVEVAQAARHTARGFLEKAQVELANLLVQGRKSNFGEVQKKADTVGELLKDVERTLDRIRDAMRPARRELTKVSLRDSWEEIFRLLGGRLASLGVRPNLTGPDVKVDAYPDLLRHAWLNLVLNSIDAFRDRKQGGARLIAVTIDPVSAESSPDVKLKYVDSASGIDQSKFRQMFPDSTRPVRELIFEPGVSTKPEGSGFGLTLVRKILQDHFGSIDLVEQKNGVVFEIKLRKQH